MVHVTQKRHKEKGGHLKISQSEVLTVLYNLGGSGWHDDITDSYNKIHFPRNIEYRQLSNLVVKKTMQGDLAKLLKRGLITRIYRKPSKKRLHRKTHRIEGYYSLTEAGLDYIKRYNIITTICR